MNFIILKNVLGNESRNNGSPCTCVTTGMWTFFIEEREDKTRNIDNNNESIFEQLEGN